MPTTSTVAVGRQVQQTPSPFEHHLQQSLALLTILHSGSIPSRAALDAYAFTRGWAAGYVRRAFARHLSSHAIDTLVSEALEDLASEAPYSVVSVRVKFIQILERHRKREQPGRKREVATVSYTDEETALTISTALAVDGQSRPVLVPRSQGRGDGGPASQRGQEVDKSAEKADKRPRSTIQPCEGSRIASNAGYMARTSTVYYPLAHVERVVQAVLARFDIALELLNPRYRAAIISDLQGGNPEPQVLSGADAQALRRAYRQLNTHLKKLLAVDLDRANETHLDPIECTVLEDALAIIRKNQLEDVLDYIARRLDQNE